MASNLGPADISTTMKYAAPNPSEKGEGSLMLVLLAAGAAYLLFTPGGQAEVAKLKADLASKFQGGAPVGS